MNRSTFIPSGGLATISRDNFLKKAKAVLHSLRFRLIVLILICGIVPSVAVWEMGISTYRKRSEESRASDVSSQCYILANQISSSDFLTNPNSEKMEEGIRQLADFYSGRVMVVNGSFQIVYDSFGLDDGRILVSSEAIRAMSGESCSLKNTADGYIEVSVPISSEGNGNSSDVSGVIVASVSSATLEDNEEYIVSRTLMILLCVIVVVILLAVVIPLLIERPIRRMKKAAGDVEAGFIDGSEPIHTYTELQGLMDTLDSAIARIKTVDESRNEFVSNVSHELKTPIASMKVLADSLLTQEEVPNEIYREFMEDIAREIDRETNIINDLLTLVRLDKRNSIEITSININDLLEYVLKRLRPIAQQKNVELVLESYRAVVAEADETKLSQALTNLVENAVKYNQDGGWVHVTLNADHRYFYVRIEDNGIGIPDEDQERVFERFYRVDKSHSKEIGGTGLGLAITRNIVLMHRGEIKLYSKEGEGTTFQLRIPLFYTP